MTNVCVEKSSADALAAELSERRLGDMCTKLGLTFLPYAHPGTKVTAKGRTDEGVHVHIQMWGENAEAVRAEMMDYLDDIGPRIVGRKVGRHRRILDEIREARSRHIEMRKPVKAAIDEVFTILGGAQPIVSSAVVPANIDDVLLAQLEQIEQLDPMGLSPRR